MHIETRFGPGDMVGHIADDGVKGVIGSFSVRGANHSYEVIWGTDKCSWHLDFELVPLGKKQNIGLWRQEP